jgi:hypothetical protein
MNLALAHAEAEYFKNHALGAHSIRQKLVIAATKGGEQGASTLGSGAPRKPVIRLKMGGKQDVLTHGLECLGNQ